MAVGAAAVALAAVSARSRGPLKASAGATRGQPRFAGLSEDVSTQQVGKAQPRQDRMGIFEYIADMLMVDRPSAGSLLGPALGGHRAAPNTSDAAGALADEEPPDTGSPVWVVQNGPVLVRESRSVDSKILARKLDGERLLGRRRGNWLDLAGERGHMQIAKPWKHAGHLVQLEQSHGNASQGQENETAWVVQDGTVFVREHGSAWSKVVSMKQNGTRVFGQHHGDWLALSEGRGFMEIARPRRPREVRLVLLRQLNTSFKEVENSTCDDAGLKPILNPLLCDAAAHKLGSGRVHMVLPRGGNETGGEPGCGARNDSQATLCCIQGCPSARNTTTITTTTTSSFQTTTEITSTPKLFCFAVLRASSYEAPLLRAAYSVSSSVFGCNAWAVYSDVKAWLGGRDHSEPIPGPPAVYVGLWLNVDIFFRAWNKVFEAGVFRQNDWVIKVDPDAVFFPERMRQHLRQYNFPPDSKKYFKNCPKFQSMQGPLEVFSRGAIEALATESWKCRQWIDQSHIGEDGFFQKCMEILGAEQVFDWTLLMDQYCGEQRAPCSNYWTVAYHPYKPLEEYYRCLNESSFNLSTWVWP